MSKLNKTLEGVFAANPKANKLFVTSDGQVFVSEVHANNHQWTLNRNTRKLSELKTYTRKDLQPAKPAGPTVEDRITAINAAETVEAVNALLKGESAKTVKEAAEARKLELTQPAE